MDYYDLSAASFADKIDVGRSSISHLLSGRNKPSLDFVLKVVQAFPDVELYWLLNGKGSFPRSKEDSSLSENQKRSISSPNLFNSQEKPVNKNLGAEKHEIKRIVLFYTDGTFEAFENCLSYKNG